MVSHAFPALPLYVSHTYPGRNPDTVIFHRVHPAIEEVSSLHDPATKHFILADSEEQECTRTVVFAVFTACYEFFGACHWTQVTQVWDILDLCGGEKGWVIYHNNQRLRHHKVSVHHGDFCACYERCDSNTPFQADLPRQILPRSRNTSLLLCMAKLLDQLRWRHRSLTLPTLLKTLAPPHLSKQGILYC